MKKQFTYYFLLFHLLCTDAIFAQSLGLNWLFKPGMRFTTSFITKQNVQDTINFGAIHFNTSLIIPVKGKAELNLGELNLRGSQTFFTVNAGTRFLQTELLGFQKLTHNFSFGVTHLEASMKNGVWFYTVNMGVVESPETFNNISPFFIGAAAKIVMRDFYNHNIYGVGITYNYDRFIPFPLFGINRQLTDNWKLSMILPAYAELIYSKDEDFQFAIRTDFSTFRTGIIPPNERALTPAQAREKASLQYRDVRLAGSVRYSPSSRVRFLGQVGIATFRSLRTFQGAELMRSLVPPIAPFINVAIHINFGNAPLGSQIFGNEF